MENFDSEIEKLMDIESLMREVKEEMKLIEEANVKIPERFYMDYKESVNEFLGNYVGAKDSLIYPISEMLEDIQLEEMEIPFSKSDQTDSIFDLNDLDSSIEATLWKGKEPLNFFQEKEASKPEFSQEREGYLNHLNCLRKAHHILN